MNNKRTLCHMVLVSLVALAWMPGRAAADQRPTYQRGVLIELRGMVSPLMRAYLERKLARARQMQADLIVLEIDSGGGYLETTFEMATMLRDLDWAHTVAFVPNEALSGAAIITLGCDDIVMRPKARLGDAGPIVRGSDALFRYVPEKIRSDLARRVRDLAEAKGRPPALAEAMVDMELKVFQMTNKETGDVTFMAEHDIAALAKPDQWERGKPIIESRSEKFLEVNGQRAVELHLATAIVRDRQQLAQRYPTAQPLVILRHTGVDTAVIVLNSPIVTGLLFVVGLVALYFELSAPGIGIGGLISGLCFALFFWSRFLGGTSGWLEVILFLAGLVFLGVEIFVIPGFGVAGITGLLLLFGSIVMASQTHIIPQSPRELEHTGYSLLVLVGAITVGVVGMAMVTHYYGSIPLLGRLVLRTNVDDGPFDLEDGAQPESLGTEDRVHIGDWGVAESPLRPAGRAVFHDMSVDVVTEGAFVEAGRQVRVIRIQGNRVVVREVRDAGTV